MYKYIGSSALELLCRCTPTNTQSITHTTHTTQAAGLFLKFDVYCVLAPCKPYLFLFLFIRQLGCIEEEVRLDRSKQNLIENSF